MAEKGNKGDDFLKQSDIANLLAQDEDSMDSLDLMSEMNEIINEPNLLASTSAPGFDGSSLEELLTQRSKTTKPPVIERSNLFAAAAQFASTLISTKNIKTESKGEFGELDKIGGEATSEIAPKIKQETCDDSYQESTTVVRKPVGQNSGNITKMVKKSVTALPVDLAKVKQEGAPVVMLTKLDPNITSVTLDKRGGIQSVHLNEMAERKSTYSKAVVVQASQSTSSNTKEFGMRRNESSKSSSKMIATNKPHKVTAKGDNVQGQAMFQSASRYELSLNSIEMEDMTSDAFRKFLNLALDCIVHFNSVDPTSLFGSVVLFFDDFVSLKSAVERLAQLPVFKHSYIVSVVIKKYDFLRAHNKQLMCMNNCLRAKLQFKIDVVKIERLRQLVSLKDPKRQKRMPKNAIIEKVPTMTSREMMLLLFPFSTGVYNWDKGSSDLTGCCQLEFESQDMMEAVLDSFQEQCIYSVQPIAAPDPAKSQEFHLILKNYRPRRTPPGLSGQGREDETDQPEANRGKDLGDRRAQCGDRKRPHQERERGRSEEKKICLTTRSEKAGVEVKTGLTASTGHQSVHEAITEMGLDPTNPAVIQILEISNQLRALEARKVLNTIKDEHQLKRASNTNKDELRMKPFKNAPSTTGLLGAAPAVGARPDSHENLDRSSNNDIKPGLLGARPDSHENLDRSSNNDIKPGLLGARPDRHKNLYRSSNKDINPGLLGVAPIAIPHKNSLTTIEQSSEGQKDSQAMIEQSGGGQRGKFSPMLSPDQNGSFRERVAVGHGRGRGANIVTRRYQHCQSRDTTQEIGANTVTRRYQHCQSRDTTQEIDWCQKGIDPSANDAPLEFHKAGPSISTEEAVRQDMAYTRQALDHQSQRFSDKPDCNLANQREETSLPLQFGKHAVKKSPQTILLEKRQKEVEDRRKKEEERLRMEEEERQKRAEEVRQKDRQRKEERNRMEREADERRRREEEVRKQGEMSKRPVVFLSRHEDNEEIQSDVNRDGFYRHVTQSDVNRDGFYRNVTQSDVNRDGFYRNVTASKETQSDVNRDGFYRNLTAKLQPRSPVAATNIWEPSSHSRQFGIRELKDRGFSTSLADTRQFSFEEQCSYNERSSHDTGPNGATEPVSKDRQFGEREHTSRQFGKRESTARGGQFGEREPTASGGQFGGREPTARGRQFGARNPPARDGQFGETKPTARDGQFGEREPTTKGGQFGEREPTARSGQFGEREPTARDGQFGEREPTARGGQFGEREPTARDGQFGERTPTARGGQFGAREPTVRGGQFGEREPPTRGGQFGAKEPTARGGQFGAREPPTRGGQFGVREPPKKGGQFGEREPTARGLQLGEREPTTRGGQFDEREPSARGGQFGEREPSTRGGQFGEREPTASGGQFGEREPTARGGQFGERKPSARGGQFGKSEPPARDGQFGGREHTSRDGLFDEREAPARGWQFGEREPTASGGQFDEREPTASDGQFGTRGPSSGVGHFGSMEATSDVRQIGHWEHTSCSEEFGSNKSTLRDRQFLAGERSRGRQFVGRKPFRGGRHFDTGRPTMVGQFSVREPTLDERHEWGDTRNESQPTYEPTHGGANGNYEESGYSAPGFTVDNHGREVNYDTAIYQFNTEDIKDTYASNTEDLNLGATYQSYTEDIQGKDFCDAYQSKTEEFPSQHSLNYSGKGWPSTNVCEGDQVKDKKLWLPRGRGLSQSFRRGSRARGDRNFVNTRGFDRGRGTNRGNERGRLIGQAEGIQRGFMRNSQGHETSCLGLSKGNEKELSITRCSGRGLTPGSRGVNMRGSGRGLTPGSQGVNMRGSGRGLTPGSRGVNMRGSGRGLTPGSRGVNMRGSGRGLTPGSQGVNMRGSGRGLTPGSRGVNISGSGRGLTPGSGGGRNLYWHFNEK